MFIKKSGPPELGEVLTVCKEPDNLHDRHAVCVKKDGAIVGHVPHELARTMDVFIEKEWCRDMYCHRETQERIYGI